MSGRCWGETSTTPTLVVVWTERPVAGGQQLQLWSAGHEPLACLQHIAHVSPVGRNGGHPDQGPAVQVQVPGLGSRDVEALAELSDHRSDQGSLLLQRVDVTEEDVQLYRTDVHRTPPWLVAVGNRHRGGVGNRSSVTNPTAVGSGAGLLAQLVGLDLIADPQVVVRREGEAALEALANR